MAAVEIAAVEVVLSVVVIVVVEVVIIVLNSIYLHIHYPSSRATLAEYILSIIWKSLILPLGRGQPSPLAQFIPFVS